MGSFRMPIADNDPVRDFRAGSPERDALNRELELRKQRVDDIPLLIGEQRVTNEDRFEVVAPHDHKQVLARVSKASAGDIDRAVKVAIEAQRQWMDLPWEQRAAVFIKAAELLTERYRPAINATTMLGQSKTVHQAEVDAACELIDFLRYNVAYLQDIYQHQPRSTSNVWNRCEYRGLEGFVYAITPFNFTSIAINIASAPALMGCAVLWKPSDYAALSSWVGMEVLLEAGLPPGVINFVPGDPVQVTEQVLQHEQFAGLHFTGSTEVFRSLWAKVGTQVHKYRNYPRLVGETGGKGFVFAHSSCDKQSLINQLIRGAFEYQGQKCSAASRAYLPNSVWQEIKDQLIAKVSELSIGDTCDFKNFMGALISDRAFKKVTSYLNEAKNSDEVQVVIGGGSDDSTGYFVEPTILLVSNPNHRLMREEIFGPVLSIYVYEDQDVDRTLELCDSASPYALTGAIFANDRQAINKLSRALRYTAGNFYVNDKPTGAIIGHQPFGGSRASGTNDKAGSYLNLTRWMSTRTIKENLLPLTDYRYPYMG